MKEPAKKNMYKGVSAAYGVIVMTYWQLAFTGYWAFGSQVQPYILSSLIIPEWTIVMANIFAVIQISGCFQVQVYSPLMCYIALKITQETSSVFSDVSDWRFPFLSIRIKN